MKSKGDEGILETESLFGSHGRRVLVFGPAYLDRVLRVDQPLVDPRLGPALDGSVEGIWVAGHEGLTLRDPCGATLTIALPARWPGPTGQVALDRPLIPGASSWRRAVRGLDWHDDLGGMGAGFAAALGGVLISALGPEDDALSGRVAARLEREGIAHRPIRVEGHAADWTLLLTSAAFGDKLAVGFRGCHAALASFSPWVDEPSDLRVVASVPNRLAAEALRGAKAGVRLFAPAIRNMLDRDPPVGAFAAVVDLLSCNAREWHALADREAVLARVPIVAVTDGPRGSRVGFRDRGGRRVELVVPAFPRQSPPRDTNRAGEAYAATLVASLLDSGWVPGPIEEDLIRSVSWRAAAASALVLDRTDFGFPTPAEIDAALAAGYVAAGPT
jgi:sugar/nucleoside kinase (ribokinase family)